MDYVYAEDIIDKAVRVRHLKKKGSVKRKILQFTDTRKQMKKTGKTLYIYGTDIPKIIELQNNEPELKNYIQITTTYGRSGMGNSL
jgi:glycerol-3-phosphate dehydrogenase